VEKQDVLIIGGSMAGRTAAVAASNHYKEAKIAIIRPQEKDQVMVPCGLPYIFGTLGSVEKNVTPDAMILDRGIELIVDQAISIDREAKIVTTAKGREIGYEKLILATGSVPVIPSIQGKDLENVFVAKKDMQYLNNVLTVLEEIKHIAIIGGGFIGVEFADEFRKRGLQVTIVEILPHCLQLVFSEDFCILAEDKMRERGINLMTNARAKAILGRTKVERVELASGDYIDADMVLFGVGVRPNVELAQKAGLKTGESGAIWVDEYGRTSDEQIFAIGDCSEKISFFTKEPSALRLSSIAAREGRIVGANVFEQKRRNDGVIGSFSTIIGDLGLGLAGLTAEAAREANFEVVTGEFKTRDKHPGTMPGSSEIRMRLVFDKAKGEILGAELSGGSTVADITNTLAALIQARMRADEVATYQYGVHPALTSAPSTHPIPNAAEDALAKW
jgi:NADPH-dependent 2,4-dienoyl-CoA reductase/sulfur reductase-like enzyme